MKILIIGNGGRESSLACKLKEDARVSKMFFSQGNATTAILGENISIKEIKELCDFAIKEEIDLTIVGPEAPLVEGIVDEFQKHHLKIFGPHQQAALLEGSKAFSKKFMQKYGVKTADAKIFDSYEEAIYYVEKQQYPLVIKASGLAAGKGVVICQDKESAEATIHDFMIKKIYGDEGIRIVIEDYLVGFEASIIAFSNGKELFPCIAAKDYKKVGNGDKGANTGGMGSVAPSPEFTQEHMEDFRKNILEPTLKGIHAEKLNFKGFIFFGLLVTKEGTYCLEYNMRFGDPETQVIMPLLENSLLDLIQDCLDEKSIELKFRDEKSVCLVLCSGGYPGTIETGFEITGLDRVKNSQILFAGAEKIGDKILTTGGRVLNVVSTGKTYNKAKENVYQDAHVINFDYAFYREDIADF